MTATPTGGRSAPSSEEDREVLGQQHVLVEVDLAPRELPLDADAAQSVVAVADQVLAAILVDQEATRRIDLEVLTRLISPFPSLWLWSSKAIQGESAARGRGEALSRRNRPLPERRPPKCFGAKSLSEP